MLDYVLNVDAQLVAGVELQGVINRHRMAVVGMGRSYRIPWYCSFGHGRRIIVGKLQPAGKAHLKECPGYTKRNLFVLPVACIPKWQQVIGIPMEYLGRAAPQL